VADRVIRLEEIENIKNEDELFVFVEYSPEAAERIGYSDYSYWKSVFQHFFEEKICGGSIVYFYRAGCLFICRPCDRKLPLRGFDT